MRIRDLRIYRRSRPTGSATRSGSPIWARKENLNRIYNLLTQINIEPNPCLPDSHCITKPATVLFNSDGVLTSGREWGKLRKATIGVLKLMLILEGY